uniref:Uncharacterized protein n=1 Tax=Timema cristinae TaxID=61476 RepID=A0A7R9CFB6_TIMCR|nr:unnamed protein product [Timema cristinae]
MQSATVCVLRHNLMKLIPNAPENTAEVMTSRQKMAIMPSTVMVYDTQNEKIRARLAGLLEQLEDPGKMRAQFQGQVFPLPPTTFLPASPKQLHNSKTFHGPPKKNARDPQFGNHWSGYNDGVNTHNYVSEITVIKICCLLLVKKKYVRNRQGENRERQHVAEITFHFESVDGSRAAPCGIPYILAAVMAARGLDCLDLVTITPFNRETSAAHGSSEHINTPLTLNKKNKTVSSEGYVSPPHGSPMASLVLTDSSQLTSDSQRLGIYLSFDCQK